MPIMKATAYKAPESSPAFADGLSGSARRIAVFLLCAVFLLNADEGLDPALSRRVNTRELERTRYKNVLYINSYHYGYPWSDSILRSAQRHFDHSKTNIRLHTVFLDSKRIQDPETWKGILLERFHAYPEDYFDLIMLSDDNAMNTLLDLGHGYHRVPVVFCGISEDAASVRTRCPNFVGVEDRIPFYENIRLGLELFPETEHIAVVTDNSETGRTHRAVAEKALDSLRLKDKKLIWLDGKRGLTTGELLQRLRDLPENTIVIFSVWQVGGGGNYREVDAVYPLITTASSAPVFTNNDLGLEHGFFGGYLNSSKDQGELAAALGVRLLSGVPPEDVNNVKDTPECHINWREMKRWEVRESRLPEKAYIFNRPPTIYRQYTLFFWLMLGFIILLFVLFWIILIYHFRYRYYEEERTKLTRQTKLLAQRYHVLFDQSSTAIVIFDLDTGRVRDVNPRAVDMFAAPRKHLINYSLKDYFDDYDGLSEKIEKLCEGPFEMELRRHKGGTFDARVTANILREGEDCLIYAAVNDISLRKRQEKEILEGRQKLKETLLYSKNSYWEWDLKKNILHKEDTFWRALDIDPETLKEDPEDVEYYLEHMHPGDRKRFTGAVGEAVRGESNVISAECRMHFFGRETWVEIRGAISKRDAGGEGILMSGFMMNIDTRKKQEQELVQAKEKAEESDRLKSAFISNISHEIRTPLNGIVGFSNLLGRENIGPEDKRKYIKFINENNDQLLKLINDILEISKIETDILTLHPEPCNLYKLCEDIVYQESIDLKPTLKLELAKAEKIKIMVDKTKLIQVIKNLLSNAKKFTEKGEILAGYSVKRDMIEFFVRDTGIGIPEDKQEMIFERFTQADPFSKGTGLGLAISKALAEKMGGKIWVKSEEGKGSVFYFTFKYQKAGLKFGEIEPGRESRDGTEDESGPRKTVLVAAPEDSDFVLFNVVLKGKYHIIRARDSGEVLSHVRRYRPDAVLAGSALLEKDRYSVLKAVKNRGRDLPVIAVCSTEPEDGGKALKNAGVDSYLSKPVNIRHLLEKLEKLVGNGKSAARGEK